MLKKKPTGEREEPARKRRLYRAPEMIIYGTVKTLALGSTQGSEDTNTNHPSYHS